jgi:hypothetical protein
VFLTYFEGRMSGKKLIKVLPASSKFKNSGHDKVCFNLQFLPCSDMARIQFRLPDGSSHSHTFEATATLGEVRSYVGTHLSFPFR